MRTAPPAHRRWVFTPSSLRTEPGVYSVGESVFPLCIQAAPAISFPRRCRSAPARTTSYSMLYVQTWCYHTTAHSARANCILLYTIHGCCYCCCASAEAARMTPAYDIPLSTYLLLIGGLIRLFSVTSSNQGKENLAGVRTREAGHGKPATTRRRRRSGGGPAEALPKGLAGGTPSD